MNQNQGQGQAQGNQGSTQFGAHEIIGMNEALMTKAANIEVLSFLSQQVQDQQLQHMLQQQAQAGHQHYMQGVSLLQGQATGATQPGSFMSPHLNANMQPKLGLRNPSMPYPNMQASTPSEQSIGTLVLNMHKHGAVAWTTFALECTNPQLRTFLMQGASMCDQMAYETWSFLNQKGYYQVPTLLEKTTQSMIQAYQVPQNAPMMQGTMNSLQ